MLNKRQVGLAGAATIIGLLAAGCAPRNAASEKDKKVPDDAVTLAWSLEQIKLMGGVVTTQPNLPGNPVVAIDLDGKRIGNKVVAPLAELTELRELKLAKTSITDPVLLQLKSLTRLQVLMLTNTHVTDAGVQYLTDMASLQVLGLGETEVTDTGLAALQKMTNLQTIYLSQTKATPAGIKKLRDALPGARIVD